MQPARSPIPRSARDRGLREHHRLRDHGSAADGPYGRPVDVIAVIWPPVVLLLVGLLAVALLRRQAGATHASTRATGVLIGVAVADVVLMVGTALVLR